MTENIYLFVPNIIVLQRRSRYNFLDLAKYVASTGVILNLFTLSVTLLSIFFSDPLMFSYDYFRVVFAFISFYYMPFDPTKATVFYLLSGFLDAFDGHLARMLNQCSKLGAMLDQLIDRITTMCLCAALCQLYPSYMLFFQFAMALDIFSHWMHCQSSVQRGNTSHKKIDLSANPILRHYYHNQAILFTMCAANELFFCTLYLNYFTAGPLIPVLGIGLWKVLCVLCAPLSILKMVISAVQLGAACENYAIMDREDREKMAEEKKKQG